MATLREALQKVSAVSDQGYKAWGTHMIAEVVIEAGDPTGAATILHQAAQTASGSRRDFALEYVATSLAKAGDVAGAHQVAASIQDTMHKVRAFEGIGGILWRGGDRTRAAASFEQAFQISVMNKSDVGFRDTGNTQANVGDIPGALKTVASMADGYSHKYEVLAAIARAQFKTGDRSTAQATLQEALRKAAAQTDNVKDWACWYIAPLRSEERRVGKECRL